MAEPTPTVLDLSDDREKKNPGGLTSSYRTSSKFLLQVKDGKVSTITDAIEAAIKKMVGPDKDIVSLDFKPDGCIYTMELGPNLHDADKNYRLEVELHAADIDGVKNFVAYTLLVPKGDDPTKKASGFADAKGVHELLTFDVRKAIVRLEFPDFPEGKSGRTFKEIYRVNAKLQSGSFATVYRGTHRESGRKVAVKSVIRKKLPPEDDASIIDEVAILSSLDHPHIVPITDFFEEDDYYFIIMELMIGGDLFDRIGEKKAYSEADARELVYALLRAMEFCHSRSIVHRDLKPENLLLCSASDDADIKLADFGFACRVHEPKSLTKQCGTAFFISPEILLRRGYDQCTDMWSVGCIVFLLLSGTLPFGGRSQRELFRNIVAGKYDMDADIWESVSPGAKDLVQKLLLFDPAKRITAVEAIEHEWIAASDSALRGHLLKGTSTRLKSFNAKMKLRSAMIALDWAVAMKRVRAYAKHREDGTVTNSMSELPTPKKAAAADEDDAISVEGDDEVKA